MKITRDSIYDFVKTHSHEVSDLLMEQRVYTMLDLLKKSGYEDYLKEMPKANYLDMVDTIRNLLGVPSIKIQEDIFELSMMVDVLLLRISNMTGLDVDKCENSLKLINIFGSYEHIKCYLEAEYKVNL